MALSKSNLKLSGDSNRDFWDWWTLKYGVIEHDGKALFSLL
jgi:hypothetical protein